MSVKGEFVRILGAYVELLDAADAVSAREGAALLREINDACREAQGGHALERAAHRVLEQLKPGGAIDRIELRRAGEREHLERETRHLVALCRAISGEVEA